MRLRDSWLFRVCLAGVGCGAILALIGSEAAPAVESAAAGYLLILVSMYRAGVRVFTRGGIVTKEESPWTYRASFLVMSVFGFGPLCIAISMSIQGLQACHTVWCLLEIGVMAVSGVLVLLLIALAFGAAAVGLIAPVYRAARKALTPPSSGRL
jgi:hypothetical protein